MALLKRFSVASTLLPLCFVMAPEISGVLVALSLYGNRPCYVNVDVSIVILAASFPVVLGDFGCDVTCQACRENRPGYEAVILGVLGSKVQNFLKNFRHASNIHQKQPFA